MPKPKPVVVETPKPVVAETPKPESPVTFNTVPSSVSNANPNPINPEIEGHYFNITIQVGSEEIIVDAIVDEHEIVFTKRSTMSTFMKHAFSHLKRWAITQRGLILDFGAYENNHVVVKGDQPVIDAMGKRISSCINILCSKTAPEITPKIAPEIPKPTPEAPKTSPEMTKLLELGFTDKTKNANLLAKYHNDLVKVIGELLGH